MNVNLDKPKGSPKFDRQLGQGKLTYTAVLVGILTVVFQLFGKNFPTVEAEAFAGWCESNWPAIQVGISLAVAFYGRMRREFR